MYYLLPLAALVPLYLYRHLYISRPTGNACPYLSANNQTAATFVAQAHNDLHFKKMIILVGSTISTEEVGMRWRDDADKKMPPTKDDVEDADSDPLGGSIFADPSSDYTSLQLFAHMFSDNVTSSPADLLDSVPADRNSMTFLRRLQEEPDPRAGLDNHTTHPTGDREGHHTGTSTATPVGGAVSLGSNTGSGTISEVLETVVSTTKPAVIHDQLPGVDMEPPGEAEPGDDWTQLEGSPVHPVSEPSASRPGETVERLADEALAAPPGPSVGPSGMWLQGFSLANIVVVETFEGWVVFDAGESTNTTLQALEQLAELIASWEPSVCERAGRRVTHVFLSHHHTDHTGGINGVLRFNEQQGESVAVTILAHAETNEAMLNFYLAMATKKFKRAVKQFGTAKSLRDHEPTSISAGIGGAYTLERDDPPGIIFPNYVWEGASLDVPLSPHLRIQALYLPGETQDQVCFFVPQLSLFHFSDNFYFSFPNVYPLRGGPYRSPAVWQESLDVYLHQYWSKTKVATLGHTSPVFGRDAIRYIVERYRDALAFVQHQTIRLLDKTSDINLIADHVNSLFWTAFPQFVPEKMLENDNEGPLDDKGSLDVARRMSRDRSFGHHRPYDGQSGADINTASSSRGPLRTMGRNAGSAWSRSVESVEANLNQDVVSNMLTDPLMPYYGQLEWAVKAVADAQMGWFDENPIKLNAHKLNNGDRSRKLNQVVDTLGAAAYSDTIPVLKELVQDYISQGECQWALELCELFGSSQQKLPERVQLGQCQKLSAELHDLIRDGELRDDALPLSGQGAAAGRSTVSLLDEALESADKLEDDDDDGYAVVDESHMSPDWQASVKIVGGSLVAGPGVSHGGGVPKSLDEGAAHGGVSNGGASDGGASDAGFTESGDFAEDFAGESGEFSAGSGDFSGESGGIAVRNKLLEKLVRHQWESSHCVKTSEESTPGSRPVSEARLVGSDLQCLRKKALWCLAEQEISASGRNWYLSEAASTDADEDGKAFTRMMRDIVIENIADLDPVVKGLSYRFVPFGDAKHSKESCIFYLTILPEKNMRNSVDDPVLNTLPNVIKMEPIENQAITYEILFRNQVFNVKRINNAYDIDWYSLQHFKSFDMKLRWSGLKAIFLRKHSAPRLIMDGKLKLPTEFPVPITALQQARSDQEIKNRVNAILNKKGRLGVVDRIRMFILFAEIMLSLETR
ncbi:beta-lactamase domain protein [Gregarina niphandrodes]|uniref:Beta-lactamase domain protein n=1 Tax=Gregarina niphandrodes TaxID=110365 RepID=A0A023B997_GRENI|nr:beta-lactamase domain protein [Gregarina niphandrodes]EZG71756.1 beta-lactamase domain protein [Gregarina niphandrodes]|eukprot:XP_011129811.1 beta-lactamase domain protein [Gregarina niphandrodes]